MQCLNTSRRRPIDTSHKWQRWALKIREYDFEVKRRAGTYVREDNNNADEAN